MKIKKRKIKKGMKIPAAVFFLCCVAFVIYYSMTRGMGDRVPPEITFQNDLIKVSAFAEEKELLRGVHAADQVDGDVTDSLVVESISQIYDQDRVTVKYAAFDHSNNVAKAERTVEYVDYTSPQFTMSAPLITKEGITFDVFDVIGAQDAIDGNLDDKVKAVLVSGEVDLGKAGEYEIEFRVTNSLGDTVHLRLPVEVLSVNASGRNLELEDYLIYLHVGDDFTPEDYLTEYSATKISTIESNVDTETPGVYSVTYYPLSRENYEKTRLVVVVEE